MWLRSRTSAVMTFLRFGPEGKIVERWSQLDEVGLMTQLGLMPALDTRAPTVISGRPEGGPGRSATSPGSRSRAGLRGSTRWHDV